MSYNKSRQCLREKDSKQKRNNSYRHSRLLLDCKQLYPKRRKNAAVERTSRRARKAACKYSSSKPFEGSLIQVGSSIQSNEVDYKDFTDYSRTKDCHEIDVFILSLDTVLLRIRFPSRSMCVRISDFLWLREGALLNDVIIDFYLNHIASHLLPDDSVLKLHLFPSLFWCRLKEFKLSKNGSSDSYELINPNAEKLSQVSYWLEEENVFDADFLILPVNHRQHWLLVIVCSPQLSIKKVSDQKDVASSSSTIVVIFDSQQPVDTPLVDHILATVKSFLQLAYNRKRAACGGNDFNSNSFKCIIPKNLPQQENDFDCGIYLLEYARRFLLAPPSMNFLQSGAFDFLSLYPDFDVSRKRREIQHTILSLCSDYDTWCNLLDTIDVPFEYNGNVVRIKERT